MKLKTFRISLVLFLAASFTVAGAAFSGGSGTSTDPYEISSCSELENMDSNVSAHYELISDVDCGGYGNFDPVMDGLTRFSGSFNGRNYTISNLYIDHNGSSTGVGLFGEVDTNHFLKNVEFDNATVYGKDATGGAGILAGYALNSSIKNVNISGELSGLGGVVSVLENGYVKESYVDVNLSSYSSNLGGAVGKSFSGTNVSKVTVNGTVDMKTDDIYVGGVVGELNGKLSLSSSVAEVKGNGTYVGGVAGGGTGTVVDSFSGGSVHGYDKVGGIVYSANKVNISYTFSQVSADQSNVGPAVTDSNTNVGTVYFDENETGFSSGTGTGLFTGEMQDAEAKCNMDALDYTQTFSLVQNDYPALNWTDPDNTLNSQDVGCDTPSIYLKDVSPDNPINQDSVTYSAEASDDVGITQMCLNVSIGSSQVIEDNCQSGNDGFWDDVYTIDVTEEKWLNATIKAFDGDGNSDTEEVNRYIGNTPATTLESPDLPTAVSRFDANGHVTAVEGYHQNYYVATKENVFKFNSTLDQQWNFSISNFDGLYEIEINYNSGSVFVLEDDSSDSNELVKINSSGGEQWRINGSAPMARIDYESTYDNIIVGTSDSGVKSFNVGDGSLDYHSMTGENLPHIATATATYAGGTNFLYEMSGDLSSSLYSKEWYEGENDQGVLDLEMVDTVEYGEVAAVAKTPGGQIELYDLQDDSSELASGSGADRMLVNQVNGNSDYFYGAGDDIAIYNSSSVDIADRVNYSFLGDGYNQFEYDFFDYVVNSGSNEYIVSDFEGNHEYVYVFDGINSGYDTVDVDTFDNLQLEINATDDNDGLEESLRCEVFVDGTSHYNFTVNEGEVETGNVPSISQDPNVHIFETKCFENSSSDVPLHTNEKLIQLNNPPNSAPSVSKIEFIFEESGSRKVVSSLDSSSENDITDVEGLTPDAFNNQTMNISFSGTSLQEKFNISDVDNQKSGEVNLDISRTDYSLQNSVAFDSNISTQRINKSFGVSVEGNRDVTANISIDERGSATVQGSNFSREIQNGSSDTFTGLFEGDWVENESSSNVNFRGDVTFGSNVPDTEIYQNVQMDNALSNVEFTDLGVSGLLHDESVCTPATTEVTLAGGESFDKQLNQTCNIAEESSYDPVEKTEVNISGSAYWNYSYEAVTQVNTNLAENEDYRYSIPVSRLDSYDSRDPDLTEIYENGESTELYLDSQVIGGSEYVQIVVPDNHTSSSMHAGEHNFSLYYYEPKDGSGGGDDDGFSVIGGGGSDEEDANDTQWDIDFRRTSYEAEPGADFQGTFIIQNYLNRENQVNITIPESGACGNFWVLDQRGLNMDTGDEFAKEGMFNLAPSSAGLGQFSSLTVPVFVSVPEEQEFAEGSLTCEPEVSTEFGTPNTLEFEVQEDTGFFSFIRGILSQAGIVDTQYSVFEGVCTDPGSIANNTTTCANGTSLDFNPNKTVSKAVSAASVALSGVILFFFGFVIYRRLPWTP